MEISIRTERREELVDITAQVNSAVRDMGLRDGYAHLWCPHTTAGLTVNEGADPDVRTDIIMALDAIVPSLRFRHSEGNSAAHVKSVLTGQFLVIPVSNGKLALGTWQSVFFCEYDGPRTRKVLLSIISRQMEAKG
ncbi:MAG: secondary thiamine-phosphate synthase enzyme YjbQ [Planctomycetota bacterium]